MKRQWMINSRKGMEMNQEQVASKVGISRSYYSQIENGTHTPAGQVALRIATFFGVDMAIFFYHKGCEYQHPSMMPVRESQQQVAK